MLRKTHHVVPNPNGGWDVKKGGGKRTSKHTSKHTELKTDAISTARSISRNQKTELVIHGKNGKIQKSDSHGNDPCPPKDKS